MQFVAGDCVQVSDLTLEHGGLIQAGMFYAQVILLLAFFAGASMGAAPKVDADSEKLLRALTEEFRAAKTAEVDLKLEAKIKAPALELSTDFSLAIARPNKFALLRKQGDLTVSAISDGTNAFTFLTKPNVYSMQSAPKDISGLESDVSSPSGDTMGSMAFIAALFNPEPYTALMAGVLEATYAGVEKNLKRINFKQEGLTWSLFVAADGKIRKIDVVIPEMQMTLEFSNWKLNPNLGPERFSFVPPADAKKVPSVFKKEVEGDDSGLVGEALPALKLKLADGGTLNTASLKGKATVLVIWAGESKHAIEALRWGSEIGRAHV